MNLDPLRSFLIASATLVIVGLSGCTVTSNAIDPTGELARAQVLTGSEVLVSDSLNLLRGKRFGLLTNHGAVDSRGRATADLLATDTRVRSAGARLVTLFAPEHGIRVDQDRAVRDTVDARTGLPVISLYGRATAAPPDSILRTLDALVFDLPDIGTRTWTYVGALIYSMQAAARVQKPILVLDRPNPITGFYVEGPMLDSSVATLERAYALFPMPLRHGLTMGELALFYNDTLKIGAQLHVIPMRRWSRDLWYDRTGIPWVRPSPAMTSLQSALLYPSLVPFERANVSVGRGTSIPFQWFGAPWLNPREIIALFRERPLRGVRFVAETLAVGNATDNKYPNQRVPGVQMIVTERNRVQPGRIGATILWALAKTSPQFRITDTLEFDRRFGSPAMRRALLRGEDPDMLMDREYAPVFAFRERVRKYLLYR